jgi:hypothetical protein
VTRTHQTEFQDLYNILGRHAMTFIWWERGGGIHLIPRDRNGGKKKLKKKKTLTI